MRILLEEGERMLVVPSVRVRNVGRRRDKVIPITVGQIVVLAPPEFVEAWQRGSP